MHALSVLARVILLGVGFLILANVLAGLIWLVTAIIYEAIVTIMRRRYTE